LYSETSLHILVRGLFLSDYLDPNRRYHMQIKKNDVINIDITSISSDGNGIGRYNGIAVFVPFTAVGDNADVRVVKVMKNYLYGIIESIKEPSPDRIDTDCPYFGKCGGCNFRHISYEAELEAKQVIVEEALKRIGGISADVNRIIPSPSETEYRNKVQFPISSENGRLFPCFYYSRSHRKLDISDSCLLQPRIMNELAVYTCEILTSIGETAYDEETRKGNIRHLLIRKSSIDDSLLMCIISYRGNLTEEDKMVSALTSRYPNLKTIIINTNKTTGNEILSDNYRIIHGDGFISDEICGVPANITYDSFFQINHDATENLYNCVKEYADLQGHQTMIDLYCGTGTIGLACCSNGDSQLHGIDVTEKSIESAISAANTLGYSKAHFYKGDSRMIEQLISRNILPDVIVTDPPRKGCSFDVLDSIVSSNAQKVIMVSCNPSTLARDLKYLVENGYSIMNIQPFDLFPRTKHVETVVLLSRK